MELICPECTKSVSDMEAARRHVRKTGHNLIDLTPETGEVLFFAPVKMGKRELKKLVEEFEIEEEFEDDDEDEEEGEEEEDEDEETEENPTETPTSQKSVTVRPVIANTTIKRSDGKYDAEIRVGKSKGRKVIKLFIFDSNLKGRNACVAGDFFRADPLGAEQAEELFSEYGFPVKVLAPIRRS